MQPKQQTTQQQAYQPKQQLEAGQLQKLKEHQGNHPEKQFRAGAISAPVWLNTGQKDNGEATKYRTISLERRYTDKEGKWQSSNSFRVNDLPKAKVALEEAYKYVVFNEQSLSNGGM